VISSDNHIGINFEDFGARRAARSDRKYPANGFPRIIFRPKCRNQRMESLPQGIFIY
jgi:hypothetical protein